LELETLSQLTDMVVVARIPCGERIFECRHRPSDYRADSRRFRWNCRFGVGLAKIIFFIVVVLFPVSLLLGGLRGGLRRG
jgi:hypothetical protein